MVTSGAAPLSVPAFRRVRRSTSSDAIPDVRRRTRRSASLTIRICAPSGSFSFCGPRTEQKLELSLTLGMLTDGYASIYENERRRERFPAHR
jgi:hypothetical protein